MTSVEIYRYDGDADKYVLRAEVFDDFTVSGTSARADTLRDRITLIRDNRQAEGTTLEWPELEEALMDNYNNGYWEAELNG